VCGGRNTGVKRDWVGEVLGGRKKEKKKWRETVSSPPAVSKAKKGEITVGARGEEKKGTNGRR